jgi:hypothetical protein
LSALCSAEDVSFIGSSPNGDTFHTTTVACTVTAQTDTPPFTGTFAIYYSTSSIFTSSVTISVAAVTSANTASIAYTFSDTDSVREGEYNWYRWGYRKGGNTFLSNPYQIIVALNKAPQISIIQPDDKGFASVKSFIEIQLLDEGLGIDEHSLDLSLIDENNASIVHIEGNSSNVFNPITGMLSYTCAPPLAQGTHYTLSISAADKGYRDPFTLTTSKTVSFGVRSDAIADVVPVPSPFNPSRENLVIQYTLASQATVEINIYDMSYRLVRNVVRAAARWAGENSADTWDGKDLANQKMANGVYIIEVKTDADAKYSSVILMQK